MIDRLPFLERLFDSDADGFMARFKVRAITSKSPKRKTPFKEIVLIRL